MNYQKFLEKKTALLMDSGFEPFFLPDSMFDFQSAITRKATKMGRYAIFADTGLGKTLMELVWAKNAAFKTRKPVLILAPLAVANQTVREAKRFGIQASIARDGVVDSKINITNYDRLHRFDSSEFSGIVLDESSIIKHHDSKTFQMLMDAFRHTPYKLCATATPAPNDWMELGTHAEFLGICTRAEMLSEFFIHDGGETQKWRLKGHAKHDFWRWVSSWAAMIRNPADLGFDASRYDLPPLNVEQITVDSDAVALPGELFPMEAQTLMQRRQARRESLSHRVKACADLVNSIAESWIVWCELNDEADALVQSIPGAVEVRGSDSPESKEKALIDFAAGDIRVLITKPKIAGFGLNWQHCRRIAFVGIGDSWESYYQSVRRCWRFGQDREVFVYLFVSDMEGAVRSNLERKQRDAEAMFELLSAETRESVRANVLGQSRYVSDYNPDQQMVLPSFIKVA